ncbi:MAG TPA: polyprenyl synthetase family protein [Acidimicrobiales bacterium]|nr:polyprenyl synthetase family protein [Acidimicrobiales bacterium]
MVNIASLLNLPFLDADLRRVEEALRGSVASSDPFLSEVAGHLIGAGGKRLRPALALAAAAAGGAPVTDDVVQGGVSVELVHLGSLYHDDVMDEATTRRGVESVNARWGNLVAILAGDFLLARASEIAASLGTEVAALLAATIGRLCEGQVGELKTAYSTDRTEADYLTSIEGKTASLVGASCRIGALSAHVERPTVDALTRFGDALGMVFQVRDDILDVVGTEAELGKPAGNDLVEGVYTLPVIRALADPSAGEELRGLLGRPLQGPERDKARDIVRATTGVEEAMVVARRYADDAAAALDGIDGPVARSMAGLAHSLLADLSGA